MLFTTIFVSFLAVITIINTIRLFKLKKELNNAELRAVTHFRKLNKIENILLQAEQDKTSAVIVTDKIREVIVSQNK